ncbi:three-helix bundle dimerization domain-containing protein [Streptomyces sp. NPDC017936]|uniref:three-helix bundle dimerization domain-containing protein n=1 Tax=Streptomyces sp. NPDC017936 TaxID=3365016 RepID=UPI0037A83AC8
MAAREDAVSPGSTEEAVRRVVEARKAAHRGRRPSQRVDAAVSAAAEHFKDSRIRDSVPVPAERRARSILESAAEVEAGDRGDARQAPGSTPHRQEAGSIHA